MNPIRKPAAQLRWCAAAFALTILLGLSCFPVSAQDDPIAQRLSPNTFFYLEWHGTPALSGSRQNNHILQLLHDPAFTSMLTAGVTHGIADNAHSVIAMMMPDAVSLLDNPFAWGVALNPEARKDSPLDKAKAVATFLVYDATGKTDLIQKWKALSQARGKAPVEVTRYDFDGVTVEVRENQKSQTPAGTQTPAKKNFTYSAQAGKYFLMSDQKEIMEDLIGRFHSAELPSASIVQNPHYAEFRKFAGSDPSLEFFGRVPDISEWNLGDKNAKTAEQFSQGTHLDRVHVIGGALTFEGQATRFHGAVLGDTSAGGPFDIAGASSAKFATLSMVDAGPSFNITRINLEATYELIRNAIMSSLPPQQSAMVGAAEAMAQGYIGMSLMDALNLFTGEFASGTSYSDQGESQQIFAATIQKPDSVLRVVRAVIGKMIVSEDTSGSTTFIDIATPYQDPKTHMQRKKPYYVAVTPQMLLVAPRKQMLRDAIVRLDTGTADPAQPSVMANPDFAGLRSRLPDKLSGLSATDIGKIPWDKMLASVEDQMAQSAGPASGQAPTDLSWIKPEVFLRYLHITVGGWWKDANGVYLDSYIQ